jgi:hypothetical protein
MSRLRYPLIALAILAMLAALWAGWVRIGWPWPVLQPGLPLAHGPLMVSGFLGTLVALERAVALRARWAYLGPAASGLGGLFLILGIPGLAGPLLLTLGSLGLALVFVAILRRYRSADTGVMAVGALAWLVGNLLWLSGWPIFHVVWWWAGFLILTIAGERLELSRLSRLSQASRRAFLVIVVIFLASLVLTLPFPGLGAHLVGVCLLALGAWLLRYDMARRTRFQHGLPRYAALCLLSGYFWLVVAGIMGIFFGGVSAGLRYDALLHAVFLGFVCAMIFGHAPIIFPAISGMPAAYHPGLYVQLVLLHASLVVRLAGDLLGLQLVRMWGGLLNGVALILFLVSTVTLLGLSRRSLVDQSKRQKSPIRAKI